VKVTAEHIFVDEGDPSGYDIVVEASELGCPPGQTPPDWVTLEVPSGDMVKLERLGQCVDENDTFLYWSYFNESGEELAIQLKVFND